MDPMMSRTDATAIRNFYKVIQQVPTVKDFPDDYELYCLAQYDVDTGEVIGLPSPKFVVSGLECIEMYTNEDNLDGFQVQRSQESVSSVSNATSIQSGTEGENTA